MQKLPPAKQRWLRFAIKGILFSLIVWGVWRSSQKSVEELRTSDWEANPTWISISGLLYALGLLPAAFFWRAIIGKLQTTPPILPLLRAYYIGHLGKYIPGKALVVLLRAGLLVSSGIKLPVGIVSVFVETLTMMAVGAFLAATITLFLMPEQPWIGWMGIGLMFLAGIPTIPPLFNRILNSQWMRRKSNRAMADDLVTDPESVVPTTITWKLVGLGWSMNLVGWILLGLSGWAVIKSLDPAMPFQITDLPYIVAGVALAMVAGFLSGLPGGIGVRELILMETLPKVTTHANALITVVLLRFIWLVTEFGISGILYWFKPKPIEPPP